MKNTKSFNGPLFVVGMPRSGTKLLRDLLNNHNDIFIPPNESKIIPYLAKVYGFYVSEDNLQNLLNEWYSSVFYRRISDAGFIVDRNTLEKSLIGCGRVPLALVLKQFYKTLADQKGATIWGDKTPTYLKHYSLLMEMYPEARFIHIVRDVRDYCLSNNKTWGKHIVRAAIRWEQSLKIFISQINRDNVLHISYEDLITDPEMVLKQVYEFLDISFTKDLIQLQKPTEKIGDARGLTVIKNNNSRKWVYQLSEKQVQKIEMVCSDTMKTFGYTPEVYNGVQKTPGKIKQRFYKIEDGYNLMKFHAKRLGGPLKAIDFIFREYKRRV